MCVDLHTHSIFSDGSTTPAELIDLAMRHGLKGLALTDHDTVEGVREACRLGRNAGLVMFTGVEISTTLREHTLHILGYGIDPDNAELHDWLVPLQNGRERRNAIILEKLRGLGVDITDEEVRQLSCCGQTGRPHIARLLVAKGVVDSFEAAFRFYLGRHKAAWEGRFSYPPGETIDMIHRAGGVAVLAHPGQIDPEMRVQPQLVRELTLRGLDGLEIHYPTHTRKMRKKLKQLAAELGLIGTGGSDFHGATRPLHRLAGVDAAFCPPDSILDDLNARLNSRAR